MAKQPKFKMSSIALLGVVLALGVNGVEKGVKINHSCIARTRSLRSRAVLGFTYLVDEWPTVDKLRSRIKNKVYINRY